MPAILRVSIYLYGDNLRPELITEILGIEPDRIIRKGELKPGSKKAIGKTGVWMFSAKGKRLNCSDAVDEIFSTLGDIKLPLTSIDGVDSAKIDVFYSSNMDSKTRVAREARLSVDQLKKMALLGLEFQLTAY